MTNLVIRLVLSGVDFPISDHGNSNARVMCVWKRSTSNNGNRTEWSPIRIGNHTSDKQNRTTAKRESDLLITSMITD